MAHRDPTFLNYSQAQAAAYAVGRSGWYPSALYNLILNYHANGGGQFLRVLDLGCGTGKATRDLSPYFEDAVGTDGSTEMINEARKDPGKSKSGKDVRYEVLEAESLDGTPGIEEGSVDLITAAMAVHWFDMEVFWKKAAKILRPKTGTVALWTIGSMYCHPAMIDSAQIQEALFDLERNALAPYEKPGNRLSRQVYEGLRMPWDLPTSEESGKLWSKESYVRRSWNEEGEVGPGSSKIYTLDLKQSEVDRPVMTGRTATSEEEAGYDVGDFFCASRHESLDKLEGSLATASMVTRWREAHPDKAGTEQDCVRVLRRKLEKLLDRADGKEEESTLHLGGATGLVLLRRS